MKIQIENLKAQMRGVQLNAYQRALALDEYYKLLDYVEELEQLTIPAVVKSVCYKDCGNTQPSGGSDNICLNCGSSIKFC